MNVIKKKMAGPIDYWKMGYSAFGAPKIFVHMFLVDGLLIDTGMRNVQKQVSQLVHHEEIEKIVLTHHHEDHAGNVECIKEIKEIEAYASPQCVKIMKNPPKIQPIRRLTWGQQKKAALLPLNMDQPVITKQYSFDIIPAPGHAIDQICLYEKDQGWLFSADVFINDSINLFMKGEQIDQTIATIKNLLTLDFEFLLCNHQPIFKNGKARLQNKLNFLEEYFDKVATEYKKGLSAKQILHSLKLKEYTMPKLMSFGEMSQINMVRSVINSLQSNKKIL